MKTEDEPIADDEWLLRRVWRDCFRPGKLPFISPRAFEPRCKGIDVDEDGISLYREACLFAASDILANVTENKRPSNGIVRVSVVFVKSLGLGVENKPEPPIKGHVVIPNLNAGDYQANKGHFTPTLHSLAVEASKLDNIVRRPESL